MNYLGDYAEDYATLNHKFTTRAATGVPTNPVGLTVAVYKGSGTTEGTAPTGITLAATGNFDSVTGLNNLLIDLSANAFYAVGEDYHVVITAGTVGGVSIVGEVVCTFSIENRTAKSASDNADAVWDEVISLALHATVGTAGDRLLKSGYIVKDEGTAAAAAAQTITLAASASAIAGIYNQDLVSIIYGTGIGQSRLIVDYTALKVATVDRPWDTALDGTSYYQVTAFSGLLFANTGTAQAGAAGTITLATSALTDVDSYVGCCIYISSGTGAGQSRLITAYTAGRVATVSPPWETEPDATSAYKVLPVGRSIVDPTASNVATPGDVQITITGEDVTIT